jgi:predicted acetyltransferase
VPGASSVGVLRSFAAAGRTAIISSVASRASPELVHPLPVEDFPAWARTMATSFLSDPHSPGTARQIEIHAPTWAPERAWGVRDGGRWVATLRSDARRLTVPGAGRETEELPVDAVTNVSVAATHRRRGLMSRMLGESLRAARERGDAVSVLIAAEWPIYGRFGYAPAVWSSNYTLRSGRAGEVPGGDPTRVRQVERDEFGEVAHAVFATARRRRAGQIDRPEVWWDRLLGRRGFPPGPELPHNWFVHEGESGPDGLVGWKAGGDWGLIPPYGHVDAWSLTASTDAAYRDLWAYLAGIDIIEEVRLSDRPVDEPIRWLLGDGRALVTTRYVDMVWLRLLDVAAALSARRYSVAGELVLQVRDGDGEGFAAGRYHLDGGPGGAECRASTASADLELTQRALAAVYLGGARLHELAVSGDAVAERTPGALALADAMFATPLAPWCATWF